MRTLLVVTLLLVAPVSALQAQTAKADFILEAERLRSTGHPQAAVAMLQPLLQPESSALSPQELGVAWDVLGSSYQDMKMPAKARASYTAAMDKLRVIPSAQSQYAATVANLGALEDSLGQQEAAKELIKKADRIYDEVGDVGGGTVTATSLAAIAYRQREFKAARHYVERAVAQASRTTGLREDDVAALSGVRSAVAFHDGHYEEALAQIQIAIEGWTRTNSIMLGLAYSLRAQAVAKLGDFPRALEDAQHAIAVTEGMQGKNTIGYFRAQIVYARILAASGQKEQAMQLDKDASRSLAELKARQCSGCTIDVSGFR